jgi:hypothetical protein
LGINNGKDLHFELFYTGEPITSETFSLTISFYAEQPSTIPATINIEPNTLNLKSKGEWITNYIELPEGYDVSDVDIASIKLNDTITIDPSAPITIKDYIEDGMSDLIVKFNKNQIIEWLYTLISIEETIHPHEVMVRTTGTIKEATFEGYQTIKIISQR